MAETYGNLYSNGPGAVGPGTHVVRSLTNPQRDKGVVTRMHVNSSGIQTSQLASLYSLSTPSFPGTVIPLDYTYVKQLSNTVALVVSYYGSSRGSNGFRRVMSRTPSGYRGVEEYPRDAQATNSRIDRDYVKDQQRTENGQKRLTPRIRYIPSVVIRWSSVVYMDIRPSDNLDMAAKYNSNQYTIDGYVHAPGTLRFDGTRVFHDKYGGIDRWTLQHTATYDYLGWQNERAEREDNQDDNGEDIWLYKGNTRLYQPYDLVQFRNLP